MNRVGQVYDWLARSPHQCRGIRILQVFLGVAYLFHVLTEWRFATYLWGASGIGGEESFVHSLGPFGELADKLFAHNSGVYLTLLLLGVSSVSLVAGRAIKAGIVGLLAGSALLDFRLWPLPDGGDNLSYLLLIYMLLLLAPKKEVPEYSLRVWFHNIGVLAIAAQIVLLYFAAGFYKSSGQMWEHGIALYYIAQVREFSLPWMSHVFSNPLIVTLVTYSTLIWEVLFPAAIFSPLRVPWLFFGVIFHLAILWMMGIVTFEIVMIGSLFFLVSDREYNAWIKFLGGLRSNLKLVKYLKKPTLPSARLYIDSFCPICQTTGRSIKSLDWFNGIEILSFRNNLSYQEYGIHAYELENRFHLVTLADRRIYAGFDAVRVLIRRLPLLWPLIPLAVVAGWCGWGEWAYRYVASRRLIIPDPSLCNDGVCQVTQAGEIPTKDVHN